MLLMPPETVQGDAWRYDKAADSEIFLNWFLFPMWKVVSLYHAFFIRPSDMQDFNFKEKGNGFVQGLFSSPLPLNQKQELDGMSVKVGGPPCMWLLGICLDPHELDNIVWKI